MKLRKPLIKRMIASVVAFGYTIGGFASCNTATSVYGPAPFDASQEDSFSPENNTAECVYGPPQSTFNAD